MYQHIAHSQGSLMLLDVMADASIFLCSKMVAIKIKKDTCSSDKLSTYRCILHTAHLVRDCLIGANSGCHWITLKWLVNLSQMNKYWHTKQTNVRIKWAEDIYWNQMTVMYLFISGRWVSSAEQSGSQVLGSLVEECTVQMDGAIWALTALANQLTVTTNRMARADFNLEWKDTVCLCFPNLNC